MYPENPSLQPVAAAPVAAVGESRLLIISRFAALAAVAAGLLLPAVAVWFPLAAGKLALMALVLLAAAVAFGIGGGAGALLARGRWYIVGLLLLPVSYLLSLWYSVDRSVAIVGTGSETDTVALVLTAFFAAVFGFALFRNSRTARMLIAVVAGVAVVAIVFQALSILIGFPGAYADKSANLIGKWNDLGILAGLFALILAVAIDFMSISRLSRIAAYVAGGVTLILLALVHFAVVWWLMLAAAALLAGVSYMAHIRARATNSEANWNKPVATGIVALVAALFLAFGSWLNPILSSRVSVATLEVRPALGSTVDIGKASHSTFMRTLLGTGPNTFDQEWLAYKPAEVNQTEFWGIDFNTGFSVVSTAFVTAGVLGVIAWLLPLLLVLFALWRFMRRSEGTTHDRMLGFLLGIASVYLLIAAFLYALSPALVVLAFVLTGAFLGYAATRAQAAAAAPAAPTRLMQIGAIAAAVLIVAGTAWPALAAGKRFFAYNYSQQAVVALQEGNTAGARALNAQSQGIETNGDNLRLGVEIELVELRTLLAATNTPADLLQQQFQAALERAVTQGRAAIEQNPRDYRPYVQLAAVYDLLVPLNIQGARESELAAYASARALNPMNPAIPLLMAEVEAGSPTATAQSVTGFLSESLKLKSNYTDALLFAVQLAVAQNDLQSALQAQTAAVSSAPDNGALWFQLGLLYYAGGDMPSASAALERALSIVSDYANAQYFLGLSYYRQGKTAEARAMFDALAKTNPQNAQVTQIIANLNAGKDPLSGMEGEGTSTGSGAR